MNSQYLYEWDQVQLVWLNLPVVGSLLSYEAYYVCRMKETLDLNCECLSESEQQEMREIR